jgi:hypothetical protein
MLLAAGIAMMSVSMPCGDAVKGRRGLLCVDVVGVVGVEEEGVVKAMRSAASSTAIVSAIDVADVLLVLVVVSADVVAYAVAAAAAMMAAEVVGAVGASCWRNLSRSERVNWVRRVSGDSRDSGISRVVG